MVVFWKQIEVKNQDKTEDDDDEVKKIPMMRYYNVFHVSDCDIPADQMAKLHLDCEIGNDDHIVPDADKMANYYLTRESIPMNWMGNQAFYRPSTDSITLPERKFFKTAAGLFGTWFHEMIHSTGAEKRLNRFGSEGAHARFGDENYSKEELVAEIGSCFLCTYCGIEMAEEETNSVAYLQSWLKALKNDPNMLISAHSKAKKAFEFIIEGFDGWEEPEEEETVTVVSDPDLTDEEVTEITEVVEDVKDITVTENTVEAKIAAVRALFEKNLITLEEYTRCIVQIAQAGDPARPFVENEGTSVPSDPEYDGTYRFSRFSDEPKGLWYELVDIQFRRAELIGYWSTYFNGIEDGDDSFCYMSSAVDDTDHISGLLPAPKTEEPEQDSDVNEDAMIYELLFAFENNILAPSQDCMIFPGLVYKAKEFAAENPDFVLRLKDTFKSIGYEYSMKTTEQVVALYLTFADAEGTKERFLYSLKANTDLFYDDRQQFHFDRIEFDGTNWLFDGHYLFDGVVKRWDVRNGELHAMFDSKKQNDKTSVKMDRVKYLLKNRHVFYSYNDGDLWVNFSNYYWKISGKSAKDWEKNSITYEFVQNVVHDVKGDFVGRMIRGYILEDNAVCPCIKMITESGKSVVIIDNVYKTFSPDVDFWVHGQYVEVYHCGIVGLIPVLSEDRAERFVPAEAE